MSVQKYYARQVISNGVVPVLTRINRAKEREAHKFR